MVDRNASTSRRHAPHGLAIMTPITQRTHRLPAAQHRQLITQQRQQLKAAKANTRRVGNATTTATYNGAEVCMPALRAGADDALQVPSRVNDRLHYRDGRVTDLQGRGVA